MKVSLSFIGILCSTLLSPYPFVTVKLSKIHILAWPQSENALITRWTRFLQTGSCPDKKAIISFFAICNPRFALWFIPICRWFDMTWRLTEGIKCVLITEIVSSVLLSSTNITSKFLLLCWLNASSSGSIRCASFLTGIIMDTFKLIEIVITNFTVLVVRLVVSNCWWLILNVIFMNDVSTK